MIGPEDMRSGQRKHTAVVARRNDRTPVWGCDGTQYAHLVGCFHSTEDVWGGGSVTMPYYTDPNNSRHLTDEELERAYPWIKETR
jgi:hypothetical protein